MTEIALKRFGNQFDYRDYGLFHLALDSSDLSSIQACFQRQRFVRRAELFLLTATSIEAMPDQPFDEAL